MSLFLLKLFIHSIFPNNHIDSCISCYLAYVINTYSYFSLYRLAIHIRYSSEHLLLQPEALPSFILILSILVSCKSNTRQYAACQFYSNDYSSKAELIHKVHEVMSMKCRELYDVRLFGTKQLVFENESLVSTDPRNEPTLLFTSICPDCDSELHTKVCGMHLTIQVSTVPTSVSLS